jgi:hypothetical protein
MVRQHEQFDDASLKAALQRHWPSDTASEMTRQRIAGLFRAPARSNRWLVRAAALLLASGLLAMVGYWGYEAYEHWEYVEANRDRFSEMARIHAADVATASAAFSTPQEASRAMNRAVATLPPDAPWTIGSTAAFPFFGQQALRTDFVRGPQRISVLSIPASALVDAHDGFSYVESVGSVTLAGAVRGDQVFCVVGDDATDRQTVANTSSKLVIVSP